MKHVARLLFLFLFLEFQEAIDASANKMYVLNGSLPEPCGAMNEREPMISTTHKVTNIVMCALMAQPSCFYVFNDGTGVCTIYKTASMGASTVGGTAAFHGMPCLATEQIGETRFFYNEVNTTFIAARANCHNKGGRLMEFDSEKKLMAIREIMKARIIAEVGFGSSFWEFWIGGVQLVDSSEYTGGWKHATSGTDVIPGHYCMNNYNHQANLALVVNYNFGLNPVHVTTCYDDQLGSSAEWRSLCECF